MRLKGIGEQLDRVPGLRLRPRVLPHVRVHAGGLPLSAEFVNSQVTAVRADCSFSMSLSMRMPDFGGAIDGPYAYTGVVAGEGAALEMAFMMHGTGPGTHVEMNRARRISMKYDEANRAARPSVDG